MIKKLNIQNIFLLVIIVIFSLIYLPHVFFNIEDIALITALETDVGSIMTSIEDLFRTPYYSMFNGYHSKFYGWSYHSLNFILLLPVKLCTYLLSYFYTFNYDMPVFFTIRLTHFILGLFGTILLFKILTIRTIVTKNITFVVAFLSSLTFLTIPVAPSLFYFVHPEILGILSSLIAIHFLLRFIDNPHLKYYYYSVAALSISVMCKQPFIFTSIPIFLSLMHFYIKSLNSSYVEFLRSNSFRKIFKKTLSIALIIIFLIHPYLFFALPVFFEIQSQLLNTFSGNISFFLSLSSWVNLLYGFSSGPAFNLIFVASFYILPFTLLTSLWLYFKDKKSIHFLALVNSLAVIFFVIMMAYGNRNFYFPTYISPIYIYLIFNLVFAFAFLFGCIKGKLFKYIFSLITLVLVLLSFGFNFKYLLDESNARINTDSLAHKTFSFIKENVRVGDKIVYDHFVAVPASHRTNAGHYWHGYGTNLIEDFNPEYVMFNAEYPTHNEFTDRLKKYVSDYDMRLLAVLQAQNKRTWMNVDPNNDHKLYSSSKVYVYVKP